MQPISNALPDDEMFDRLFGVDDRRKGKCDQHGDFVDVHFSGEKKSAKGWNGCPECNEIRRKEQLEREDQERRQAMLQDRIERTVRKSGIPDRFMGKGFDGFELVNQKAKSHLAKIREYERLVSGKDHGGRCLILLGKVGNGKTHLACALLEAVIRNTTDTCRYWTFSDLIRTVKGSFNKGSDYTEADVYEAVTQPRLVVIDEVGMQNFTDFEQAVAYELINARYMAELPTVVVTNLQAKDLQDCVGERVVDRLRENAGRALDFDWDSYRAKR